MEHVDLTMHIPRTEFLKVEEIVRSFAEKARKYVPNANQMTKVTIPNPASTLLSFSYRELRAEAQEESSHDRLATTVGMWGKVKVPDWVFKKNVEREQNMLVINLSMNKSAYDQMMSWIKQLYPTVFNFTNVDKNDFIAALGAAYAERILAGQIEVNAEIVAMS